MTPRPFLILLAAAIALDSSLARAQTSEPDFPHLRKSGAATQLIVEGQPFLVLAGELHNSSSTSRNYMKPIWPRLAQMNLNTVLAAVPWEMVEPTEGHFDFTMVDAMLADARAQKLRLGLLWFGSWKNGLSHYVPTWVKADVRRFPRALTSHGTLEILSPLSETNREADAKAFAALMKHLRQADGREHTVVLVQVENEVGLHADYRDRSEAANAAFAQPIPHDLADFLQRNRDSLRPSLRALWQTSNFKATGTWPEIFGRSPGAEEAFMAWHYARYLNRVAEAGKAEYPLPMYVNAWIVQPEDEFPGEYPSGGPQAHVLDLWHAGAPQIDIFAPDIYLPNFAEVCTQFAPLPGGPFFVPETRGGAEGAANAFLAFGAFNALGFSPFGIDGREPDDAADPLSHAYDILRQLSPLILEHQTKGTIGAVVLTAQNTARKLFVGSTTVQASLPVSRRGAQSPERGYGLVLAVGPEEYIVAGSEIQFTFLPDPASSETVGLATVEEGVFENGRWLPGRQLNGDEVMISYDLAAQTASRQTGTGLRFDGPRPSIQRVKLYRFPQTK